MSMERPNALVREMRFAAGLSQRALARRASTSQPAVVRYERGAATPSWETLQRIAHACGRRLKLDSQIAPDPHDVELVATLLALTPVERLRALRRYARLRELVAEPG
jgi:transcriptional regulator with XRE-family HTH domain